MLLNARLNDTAQKKMWKEAVHTYERMQKIMATKCSMKIPFEIFYREKPKIIGSYLVVIYMVISPSIMCMETHAL